MGRRMQGRRVSLRLPAHMLACLPACLPACLLLPPALPPLPPRRLTGPACVAAKPVNKSGLHLAMDLRWEERGRVCGGGLGRGVGRRRAGWDGLGGAGGKGLATQCLRPALLCMHFIQKEGKATRWGTQAVGKTQKKVEVVGTAAKHNFQKQEVAELGREAQSPRPSGPCAPSRRSHASPPTHLLR